jgi:Ser/Thr protein kinase RdoA (MazF antagonist)
MNKTEPYIDESARAFGIDPTTLEPLVGNSGADVFRGDSKTGPRVLKIHSALNVSMFGGKHAVLEGLQYQEGLAEQMTGDVALAGPLRSEGGEIGEEIETDDGLRIAMAFEFVPGKEVEHRVAGLQIPINDPEVGGLLYERIGRAAGIMHRYSSEYPIWWSAADTDRPGTPFSAKNNPDGSSLISGAYYWIDYADAGMADAPELQKHWESLSAALKEMTAKREEYGFIHFDYGTTNMLYDYNRLTIIDHGSMFGQFVYDIGSPFMSLGRVAVQKDRCRAYWLRFLSGYRGEFALKDEWITWLGATMDIRRLVFYIMNIQRKRDGGPNADFDMLPQWKADMVAGRPSVDIDFSLP